jgi:VIT1/CCC1 family predicted Fe2+/Mn2+ transporter
MTTPSGKQIMVTVYGNLDDQGRQDMRSMAKAKTDMFMGGFLSVGFATLLILALFLKEHGTALLAATILGLLLTGWLWRKFWTFQSVLSWMNTYEETLNAS